jgi:hypothetical protein
MPKNDNWGGGGPVKNNFFVLIAFSGNDSNSVAPCKMALPSWLRHKGLDAEDKTGFSRRCRLHGGCDPVIKSGAATTRRFVRRQECEKEMAEQHARAPCRMTRAMSPESDDKVRLKVRPQPAERAL